MAILEILKIVKSCKKNILKKCKKSYLYQKKNSFWIEEDLKHKTITICKGWKKMNLDFLQTEILKEAIIRQNQSINDTQQFDFLV